MSFEQQLELGNLWEHRILYRLQSDGYSIIPLCDGGDNSAPIIISDYQDIVLPDLLLFHPRYPMQYLEVKWKKEKTYHRKTQKNETGLALRNWQHYQTVQRITRCPVSIVFVHDTEDVIISARIDEMAAVQRIYSGDVMDYGGTVFFPWDWGGWRRWHIPPSVLAGGR